MSIDMGAAGALLVAACVLWLPPAGARAADDAAVASAGQPPADLPDGLDGLQARATYRGRVLSIEDASFDAGGTALRDDVEARLARLADFLSRHPLRDVRIEGHSDNQGTQGNGQAFSQRRADAVKAFLVARGVPARRLGAIGLGQGSPVGDNATEAGRSQNRRVEVIIGEEPAPVR